MVKTVYHGIVSAFVWIDLEEFTLTLTVSWNLSHRNDNDGSENLPIACDWWTGQDGRTAAAATKCAQ
jgi:hypothetical protein